MLSDNVDPFCVSLLLVTGLQLGCWPCIEYVSTPSPRGPRNVSIVGSTRQDPQKTTFSTQVENMHGKQEEDAGLTRKATCNGLILVQDGPGGLVGCHVVEDLASWHGTFCHS